MTTLSDKEKTDAWRVFLQTFAIVMRNLERQMQSEREMPIGWFDVLLHLNEASEGRLRMHELSESLVLMPSNLTRLIDRMEDRSEPVVKHGVTLEALMTLEDLLAVRG